MRFARVNPYDHQHIFLFWPQILVFKLTNLKTPTVDYMGFQMVPLWSIFLLCVSYKIRLKIDLFRPFYPQICEFGWADPDSTSNR